MVEEAESAVSFTVYSGNRCFVVAAPSEWQRDRWLEDISRAILAAKTTAPLPPPPVSAASLLLNVPHSSSAILDEDDDVKSERSGELPNCHQMSGKQNALAQALILIVSHMLSKISSFIALN